MTLLERPPPVDNLDPGFNKKTDLKRPATSAFQESKPLLARYARLQNPPHHELDNKQNTMTFQAVANDHRTNTTKILSQPGETHARPNVSTYEPDLPHALAGTPTRVRPHYIHKTRDHPESHLFLLSTETPYNTPLSHQPRHCGEHQR